MTERERLIELIINADTYDSYECKLCTKDDDACDCCHAEKLADHLLSNGVIVPPCKVGDTVWFIRNIGDKSREKITETSIEKVVLKRTGIHIKLDCNSMYETSCNSIGKTVFLTKEEAEKALKERSKKNG